MVELTENLLHKLEEKMMLVLTDAESLRQQVQSLQQENNALKQDKDNHARKLQDLVTLLDSVNPQEQPAPFSAEYAPAQPSLVQA